MNKMASPRPQEADKSSKELWIIGMKGKIFCGT